VSDLSKRELVLKGVIEEAKELGNQIVVDSANDKRVE
jgi:hypothetical protein